MTLRGRPGAALVVDVEAELRYTTVLRRAGTSTRKVALIAHHPTEYKVACELAGCSPLRLKAP